MNRSLGAASLDGFVLNFEDFDELSQELQLELQTAALEAIAEYYRSDARVRFVSGDYPGLMRNPAQSK